MAIFKNFKGLNNVLSPEKTASGELQVADNIDIDDSGQIRRRGGSTKVFTGSVHSLWSDGSLCLFRQSGGLLKKLNTDYTSTTLKSGIIGNLPLFYLPLNNLVYYSDSVITGIIDDNVSRTWGMAIPTAPTLLETVGDLKDGRYQVALTYIRNDGQESGSSETRVIDITSGGITVNNIPVSLDPDVNYVCIYISTQYGEMLYRAMIVSHGTTSATYRGDGSELNIPLKTAFLTPPPAGHLLEFYNGRIYIAQDNILWYTEPYAYELCNLEHNFFMFNSRITLLIAGLTGLWLSTQKENIFIQGNDPQEFKKLTKAGYGAIEGSQVKVEGKLVGGRDPIAEQVAMWATPRGICIGTSDGYFMNLTEKRYYYPSSETGSGIIIEKEGMSQYVLSLKNASIGAHNIY